jgi:hypothetical protein
VEKKLALKNLRTLAESGSYTTWKSANKAREMKDLEYGSYAYQIIDKATGKPINRYEFEACHKVAA